MAQFDKTFQTLDCSACIITPKISEVGQHENVTLLTYSELEEVSGSVGSFKVKIRKKARYVDPKLCNACGECAKVCPVVRPDEFQMGLSSRKAISIPFPQAVPCSYILNMDDCLGNNPIACGRCADVCDKHAIDYEDRDEIVTREVGRSSSPSGSDVYDPRAGRLRLPASPMSSPRWSSSG
jgi:heterodisulfide reductase subunit A